MSSIKKPYCKVCHDAGKPESEYANHWVKDLNGKTTCPTLLNTECRYCFKRGHTAKFCSALPKNNNNNNNNKQITQKRPTTIMKKPVFQKKPTNGFAVLCNDDDEEEIINIVFGIQKPEEKTWAEIASREAVNLRPAVKEVKEVKPIQTRSWADWSDSEDDDDEEEVGYY
jgi:hypothetical protein